MSDLKKDEEKKECKEKKRGNTEKLCFHKRKEE